MLTAFNTMFKNEEKLLSEVLKIWKTYPIDLFIFYDDNSIDSSVEIIKQYLPKDRFIIINDKLSEFNEGYQRQRMIDVSRDNNIDIVFAIDCDELLSSNIIKDWDKFLSIYQHQNMYLFWYNCVNDSIVQYRNDPQYANNYRSFVLPLKHTGNLNINDYKYHTPRTPNVNLPVTYSDEYGVIHLQAINRRYYAIKQLWYKHHEFIKYNHSVDFINSRYDIVVNNFNFNEKYLKKKLTEGIEFDITIFNELEKEKGYLKFILENYNEKLITFGKEYLC
jgi:hypothetical protein